VGRNLCGGAIHRALCPDRHIGAWNEGTVNRAPARWAKEDAAVAMQRYVLAIGADNAGADLKNYLKGLLESDRRVEVRDFGVPNAADETAYPHVGLAVAEAVARGEARRGLLVCGTGIGMAISANKVPGVRATVAHDSYSVERSVLSNDCQVLALGARVIGPELARRLVDEWLGYEFDPGSASAEKVAVITGYEETARHDGGAPVPAALEPVGARND